MKKQRSRKTASDTEVWPRKVPVGDVTVTVYKRKTPRGGTAFMVANKSESGKRRFDCYPTVAKALAAAEALADKLNRRQAVAAGMNNAEASDYASAIETLLPFNVSLPVVASTVADCLKLVGGLTDIHAAVKYYATRHKRTEAKPVSVVVAELLKLKEARKAAPRYLQDLRYRLNRFADSFRKDTCNVTTAEVQEWLDGQNLSPQGYTNFRRVVYMFFNFAVARGYASDNPVASAERVKVKSGDVEVFTPSEIVRLLAAAPPRFLPCLALGAFAGLRSAEIERLEWNDIRLGEKFIVVGASKAKTAGRRIVPLHDNLAAWLAPYAKEEGKVWKGRHDEFYETQQAVAAATEVAADSENCIRGEKPVKWKSNALRHSYASYRFALTGDAGRVAGELGNSAAVVHRHYRELVKPSDGQQWFGIVPHTTPNVLRLSSASVA